MFDTSVQIKDLFCTNKVINTDRQQFLPFSNYKLYNTQSLQYKMNYYRTVLPVHILNHKKATLHEIVQRGIPGCKVKQSEYTRLFFKIQDLLTMVDSNSLNVKHLHTVSSTVAFYS